MSLKVPLPPDEEAQLVLPFSTAGLGRYVGGFIPAGAFELLCRIEFYVDVERPKLIRFTTPATPIVVSEWASV